MPGNDQRRLAAIMFTDMVGYSALAQRDESLAIELLEEHRRLLRHCFTQFNGTEVDCAGDGFFAEFPSTLQAVNCAISIQKSIARRNSAEPSEKRIQVRIGVHLGDAVHREGRVMGDAINIAARLEPLAQPGGICVSRAVYDQVRTKLPLAFSPHGDIQLKNISHPVEVYSINPADGASILEAGAVGTSAEKIDQRSIAVLPFVNMSPDRENEYLSDGITEDLITALSKVPGLRVPARTSSFVFKNKNEDIRRIGQLLSVAHVLEGSVRKSGNQLRVTAQLIKVADGYHLWSEKYDRCMQDVFTIQDEINRAIVEALKVHFEERPSTSPVKHQTGSTEAYQLYRQGREWFYQRGPGLWKALHYFELALLEDPEYALAYSGLADTYFQLAFYWYLPSAEAGTKAVAAATRALQLDPTSAEANASFTLLQAEFEWELEAAPDRYKVSIALNPNYPSAYIWQAVAFACLGRYGEAIAAAKRATVIDPLSPHPRSALGWIAGFAREYDEAILSFREALELEPDYPLTHWMLGQTLVAEGKLDEGVSALERAHTLTCGGPWTAAFLAHAYAVAGRRESALLLLAQATSSGRKPFSSPFMTALVHAGLQEKDETLDWLDRAYREREAWMAFLNCLPVFDGLRDEPRFVDLLRKVGLAPAAVPNTVIRAAPSEARV
jgi:TolB-like protein/class 3 adenylate cyclase/Tfp pilus assembly protein PilF